MCHRRRPTHHLPSSRLPAGHAASSRATTGRPICPHTFLPTARLPTILATTWPTNMVTRASEAQATTSKPPRGRLQHPQAGRRWRLARVHGRWRRRVWPCDWGRARGRTLEPGVGRGLTYSSANLFLVFSNTRLKGEPFLQTGFQERGYSYLGYASPGTQKPKMDFLRLSPTV